MAREEQKLSAQAKAAALALTELQMAIRYFRLYPRDHPFCAKGIETSRDRLRSYQEKNGALEVEVQREGLFLEDELVLRESGQSTDLCTLLYPEGIRELTIEPDLSEQELHDFIDLLATNYPEEGSEATFGLDLLSALWRRNFAAIAYRVHDPLSPGFLKAPKEAVAAAPIVQRIRDLVADLSGPPRGAAREALGTGVGAGGGDGEGSGEGDELSGQVVGLDVEGFLAEIAAREAAGTLDDVANWATSPEKVDEFLKTPGGRERARLRDELADAFLGDPFGRAADVVGWSSLQDGGGRPEVEDLARFLVGSTLHSLGQGQLDRAKDMLRRIDAADAGRGELTQAVSARLTQPEGLTLIAQALEKNRGTLGPQGMVSEGVALLSRLDPAASVSGVCSLYPTVADEQVRRVFREFLGSRVSDQADAIASLTKAGDSKVKKEALGILAQGGKGTRAFKLLAEAASASAIDPEAAAIAQEQMDALTGDRERKQLAGLLRSSTDPLARLKALERLAADNTPRTFDMLAPIAEDPELAMRPPDEVQALLALITRTGGVRAVGLLTRLSEQKAPLLRGRKEVQRLKELAAAALDALRRERRA